MIKAHQQFELWGKRVIERAVIKAPFRLFAPMANEACFYYIKSGINRVLTKGETFDLQSKDGLVSCVRPTKSQKASLVITQRCSISFTKIGFEIRSSISFKKD